MKNKISGFFYIYWLSKPHIKDDRLSVWSKLMRVRLISAISVLHSITIPLSVTGLNAI